MKKSSSIIAIVLAIVIALAVGGCAPIVESKIPHFSDRQYVKVTEEQFVTLLDEAVALSKNANDGAKVIAKMDEVEKLYAVLCDSETISNITRAQDRTLKEGLIVEENVRVMALVPKASSLIIDCEKKLFASPAKNAIIAHYGYDYVESMMGGNEPTEKQQELINKEKELMGKYDGLKNSSAEAQALYVELIKLRNEIATVFGYETFTEYSYNVRHKREYDYAKVKMLNKGIKDFFAPVVKKAYAKANSLINATKLSESELLNLAEKIVTGIGNQQITDSFNYLKKYGLYDTKLSDTKQKFDRCISFPTYDDAFIYLGAYGDYSDLKVFMGLFGQFAQVRIGDNNRISSYPRVIELYDVQIYGMEAFAIREMRKHLAEDLFKSISLDYARTEVLRASTWALYEEFEQEVYRLTQEQLNSSTIIADLDARYARLVTEYGLDFAQSKVIKNYYANTYYFTNPHTYGSSSVPLVLSTQFAAENIGDKTAANVYVDFLSYNPRSSFPKVVSSVGLNEPFAREEVFKAATYYIELLRNAGVECELPIASAV